MKKFIVRFIREEEGQDIIEYGLLGAFISIAAIAAVLGIGVDVNTMFTNIDTALVPAAP
jgi:pilus assembly protein Flp/PilA